MRIGIVGLGIGGATAAASMARRGMDVTIFEQASEIREVGAGVATWPNTIRLLERLGIGEEMAKIGCAFRQTAIRTPDGSLMHNVPPIPPEGIPGYYFHRAEMLQAIASRVPHERIHLNRRCRAVRQIRNLVQIELDNGEIHEFDAVIGADGIRSVVIDAVTTAGAPIYSNLAAYRGLVPNRGAAFIEGGHMWTDRKKYLLAFPVSGGKLINFVGVVPTPGKPEESWFMAGSKAELANEFADWNPTVRAIIHGVNETFRWGLYYRQPLPNIVKGRIALMGDAAHPMLIHAGQGVGQALEDGIAIAAILEGATTGNVEERYRIYEQLRLPRATAVQLASRRNAQFMHFAFPMEPGIERPNAASNVDWILNYDVEQEVEKLVALSD